MKVSRVFDMILYEKLKTKLVMFPLLAALVVSVYVLVYQTGGVKFVYSHSMYIPVILAGFVFGARGGVVVGLVSGLVLGPYMPIDVVTGESQKLVNWLYRTGFFTLIGFINGVTWGWVKAYAVEIEWAAEHDLTTRLPNELALLNRMALIANASPTSCGFILAVISLENSVELKNIFGLKVINNVIQQLAVRLKVIGVKNYTYHLETSQLVMLAVDTTQGKERILDKITELCREPFVYDDIPVHVDIRMGVSEFSEVVQPPIVYLQEAVRAWAVAQKTSQDRAHYSPVLQAGDAEGVAMLGALRKALLLGELSMHYQPKIDIRAGNIFGVEALMRWEHPEKGNIPPNDFIPRAEQSSLIHLLTEFALDQAIQQVVEWEKSGIKIDVAVNVSTRNLLHSGFCRLVKTLLAKHGVKGERLELEVTESVMVADMDHTIAAMVKLKKLNVTFSVDDFGTGYSSLQYLHLLPVSTIKIDQSFVRKLPVDRNAVSIVESAVVLAKKMGFRVVAEGVETKESLAYLKHIGCDMAQGYLIARPMPLHAFTEFYLRCDGRMLLI